MIVLVLVGLLAVGPRRAAGAVDAQARQSQLFTQPAHRHRSSSPRWPSGRSREADTAGLDGRAAALRRRSTASPCSCSTADGPAGRHLAAGPARARRGGARAAGAGAGQPALGRLRRCCWPWDERPIVLAEPVLVDDRGARGGGHRLADRRPAHRRGAGRGSSCWRRACSRSRSRVARRAADRALDPAPGAPARRGHRPGRGGGARGRRARPGRRRQRPAGAAAALGVVRPDGRDRGAGLRRAARVRRRRQPPAAQPAHRAAAAAVQPRRARRPGRARRTRSRRWRRPSGSPRCSTGCSRWPGPSARRRSSAVDVDAGVDDRIEAWRPLAEHTGLRLRRDGPHGLRVAGDGRGHRDRAGRGAGQRGEVHAARRLDHGAPCGATPEVVEIAVRDTGPGCAARRAGAGHRPVLAQPRAQQRRRVGAGAGDRRPHRRAGGRRPHPLAPARRRPAHRGAPAAARGGTGGACLRREAVTGSTARQERRRVRRGRPRRGRRA